MSINLFEKKSDNNQFKSNKYNLAGTKWFLQITGKAYDSLVFQKNGSSYKYISEVSNNFRSKYSIKNETVYLDVYDYISQVDASKCEEVISKYKLKLKADSLICTYIAHKYAGQFVEVNDTIYKKYKGFRKVK